MTEQVKPTETELAAAKKAKFEKDPDSFIDVDDIVMACVRTEHGISTIHGACKRMELEIALTRINYKTMNVMMTMDMRSEMQKSPIITANGRVPKPGEVKFPPFK